MADEEHLRLAPLVGVWRTEGETRPSAGAPAAPIDATDTYEWLPGGRALLHTVDARVGDERVQGAEILGFDPALGAFATRYYGTDGAAAYEARMTEEGEILGWEMESENDRFAGTFDAERRVITGSWEARGEDGAWRPWMDVRLTRQAD